MKSLLVQLSGRKWEEGCSEKSFWFFFRLGILLAGVGKSVGVETVTMGFAVLGVVWVVVLIVVDFFVVVVETVVIVVGEVIFVADETLILGITVLLGTEYCFLNFS
jgi:hypothetical protein